MTTATTSTMEQLRRIWQEAAPADEKSRRLAVKSMAQTLLARDDLLVLDTETTGLSSDDEIIEIAIINKAGRSVLHTLLQPTGPIPKGATNVHGIGDYDVVGAPRMEDFGHTLVNFLQGRAVVCYNRDFDFRVINQSLRRHGYTERLFHPGRRFKRDVKHLSVDSACIMKLYAAWRGEWNAYRESYRWHRLEDTLDQCGLAFEGKAHSALSDAKAALAVLNYLATEEVSRYTPLNRAA